MGASRNTFIGLAMVAISATTLLAGCQKEDATKGIPTIINIQPDTKTSYVRQNGQSNVLWTAGDQLGVIRGTGEFSPFRLTTGEGNSSATFEGTVTGTEGDYIAVYPYSDDITYSNGSLHLTAVKPQQTLKVRSFGEGDNVSVGVSGSTSMTMQNLGGLLRLGIQQEASHLSNLKSITITASDGTKIAGTATVETNNLGITFDNNAVNAITAIAPTTDGFNLNTAIGGEFFYIVMPPCTLHGYTITIEGTNGIKDVHTYTDDLTITRATVTSKNITSDFHCYIYYHYNNSTNPSLYLEGSLNKIKNANGNVSYTTSGSATDGWIAKFDGPITTIPNKAFESTGLGSITLPNSVTSIGDEAFRNCSSLTSITFPNEVTSIGTYAFFECGNLESVTLPASVTSIGNSAFKKCGNLANVYSHPMVAPALGTTAFSNIKSTATLHIHSSADYSSWASYFDNGNRISPDLNN